MASLSAEFLRSRSLSLYRQLRELCLLLQGDQQASALVQLRLAFESNKALSGQDAIVKAQREAEQKVQYLRMITPRHMWRHAKEREPPKEVRSFVLREGELVSGEADVVGNRSKRNEDWRDPDALRRHESLLRRQYFGQTPPRKTERFF